ncbi:MAG TPA: hypothetical protein VMM56_04195, partial [Planctomycetaceae bacterium]|nr:hypothetical protein [Planctomycetaceae bacterium]
MSDASSQSASAPREEHAGTFGQGFRQVFETLLSLLISVLLVRTFLVEGYLISTGSMAPHLFGSHKKVTCPECQTE